MQSVLQEFNIKLQLEKEESLVKTQKGLLSSFWSENATTLVKDFTYHKLTHSKGVLKKILTIVKNVDLELSSDDYFILAMSALLHDIGMSIDILIHDDIQQCAIKNYHATHEPSKLIAADPNFQKYIRDNHNALSAAYCDLKLDISLDILSKEQKQAIIDCCLYHRNLNESFFTVEAINKLTKNQLLVALFRMGDELDIGTERISQGEQTAFNRPAESESYWELNKREKITISASNDVKLNIYVNNEDSNRHNINKLMNGVISDFNKKNGGLFAILCRLGVRISFNVFDSGVETVDRL
ncbi:MAG: HD domain-containing protein, partial [Clostridiales bacterium]|nr:HD domain-containing protein [Clostridiales bacterium]